VQDKKAFIVVNSASLAGSADMNIKALNELYDKYEQAGLEILMFPCN
jgi:glutathione peroxidase-family protein